MRQVIAGMLATAVLVGGCADESTGGAGGDPTVEPSTTETGAPEPRGVSFASTVTVEADQVLVEWTLVNDGDKTLLVADRVPPRGHLVADGTPLAAYVVPVDDHVELAQRVFTWPDTDKTWAVPPQVGVTRLLPGARLERRLAVAMPLAVHHPFGNDLGDGPLILPSPPVDVVFCLGVIAPPFDPALELSREEGIETLEHGRVSFAAQHAYCSEPGEL